MQVNACYLGFEKKTGISLETRQIFIPINSTYTPSLPSDICPSSCKIAIEVRSIERDNLFCGRDLGAYDLLHHHRSNRDYRPDLLACVTFFGAR